MGVKKQTSLLATAVIALGTTSTASADSAWFAGLGLGSGSASYDTSIEIRNTDTGGRLRLKDDDSESAGTFSLAVGVDREASRSYGILQGFGFDDANVSVLTFSHDWKFQAGKTVRPYLGLSIGVAALEWQNDPEADDGSTLVELKGETASSLALGFQAGILFVLNDRLNIELALRSLGTNLETKVVAEEDNLRFTATQQVTSLGSALIGVNYRF